MKWQSGKAFNRSTDDSQEPWLRGHYHFDSGARHRSEHRDVQRHLCCFAPAFPVSRSEPPCASLSNQSRRFQQPILLPDFEILKSQSQSFSELAVYYKNTGFSG